ncbi:MAG TPA: right-handed parallel beta-helix repeat-containing protein, partial [Gemmatimonadales bacterium]|nr:right-handed parallel beta-helix repeat-containing protein [Gemmatimonadales bacterium]
MVITQSVRIAPGTYALRSRDSGSAALTVRGDRIVIDLTGVTLVGTPAATDPDQRTGLAILVDGGHRVTITGGRIRGYQTGIRAVSTTDLTLRGIDASDNWRPRLFSGIGHESLIDWLSFHHNENGEWRRFGAGISLEGVHRGLLEGITVRHGMNGVMLTRSDSLRIERNDLSFNSGLGLGLYRSTDNLIVRNRVDYNVRGYSRYYRRGQDSADLLMFEQSSRNEVTSNSMTHGGDGLFLWAGQQTMDGGEGGSNDNLFYANDFSYAPTNAMEATFSRNTFAANRVVGSDHGLWGGYSYSSTVVGNCFARNRVGIAIEHGQEIRVAENTFSQDSTAIWLWADPVAPSDWGYPKHRDTRSRDWMLASNEFRGNRVALRVRQTEGLTDSANSYTDVDSIAVMRDTSRVSLQAHPPAVSYADGRCQGMPLIPVGHEWLWRGAPDPVPTSAVSLKDRSAIIIDEWGPYDWAAPRLWPIDSSINAPFQVLGPSGRWRVRKMTGLASLSKTRGGSGDTLVATPLPGREGDWSITLADSAGHPFAFTHFDPIAHWDERFYTWADSATWMGTPILTRQAPRLDMMWYGPPTRAIPQTNWAMEATSIVDLGPGDYTLRTISDDAIQVWVDGKLVIDHWTPHESLVDTAWLTPGHHALKVRYRQVDGWVECRVEIVRGHVASMGSPGPH